MDATAESKKHVPEAFDQVAGRYDLLARLNPGYHRNLRRSAERLAQPPAARILDLCCGTGLSTEALLRVYPDADLTALDASAGMLDLARRKPFAHHVAFVQGDATDPAAAGIAGPFDGIFMAYGIRNLPEPDRCLANLLALLRPGGLICFHEYSVADSLKSRLIWNAVSCAVIIPLGAALSGSAEIYRYLRRSVVAFDGVRAFEDRLRRAGFSGVRAERLDGWERGILHSFVARRPR